MPHVRADFDLNTTGHQKFFLNPLQLAIFPPWDTSMSITIQLLAGLAIAAPVYYVYCLLYNIRAARSSGIPYVVIPWFEYAIPWMLWGPYIVPILRKLPYNSWVRWVHFNWNWEDKHDVFKEIGSDIVQVVSPVKVTLWLADADVIHQVVARKDDFPKPTQIYAALDIFGKNVLTTTGNHWRTHRKITAPPFNERNNA